MTTELSFKPIKRNLWTDFEELFGPNGACAGCWCMFWKLRGKAYEEARGFETRQMHKSIVDSGVATGLLAYLHGDVVGWIAVEPRESYPKLAHSRVLQAVDDQPVWSVTCFFVAKNHAKTRSIFDMKKVLSSAKNDEINKSKWSTLVTLLLGISFCIGQLMAWEQMVDNKMFFSAVALFAVLLDTFAFSIAFFRSAAIKSLINF